MHVCSMAWQWLFYLNHTYSKQLFTGEHFCCSPTSNSPVHSTNIYCSLNGSLKSILTAFNLIETCTANERYREVIRHNTEDIILFSLIQSMWAIIQNSGRVVMDSKDKYWTVPSLLGDEYHSQNYILNRC